MGKIGGYIFLFVIIFFAIKLFGKTKDPCEDTGMAYVISQTFVKRALKDPSSASFPYSSDTVAIGSCKFSVHGDVTAPNGFGGRIKQQYSITMEYLPSSKEWRGTELSIH